MAIESVIAQNIEEEYEIIIGVDVSDDLTAHICQEYAAKYEQIRIVSPAQRIGALRNFSSVINESIGRYLFLLEGDDYWIAVDKMKVQLEAIKEGAYSFCCSEYKTVSEQNTVIKENTVERESHIVTTDDIINNFIPRTATLLLDRKYIPKNIVSCYKGIVGVDRALLLDMSKQKEGVFIDKSTAVYRINSGGTFTSRGKLGKLIVMKSDCDTLARRETDDRYRRLLGKVSHRYVFKMMLVIYNEKLYKVKETRAFLGRAAIQHPIMFLLALYKIIGSRMKRALNIKM